MPMFTAYKRSATESLQVKLDRNEYYPFHVTSKGTFLYSVKYASLYLSITAFFTAVLLVAVLSIYNLFESSWFLWLMI